jgi:hypothetical protein
MYASVAQEAAGFAFTFFETAAFRKLARIADIAILGRRVRF